MAQYGHTTLYYLMIPTCISGGVRTSVTRWIYYFYQYLAIDNNGHLPNSMRIGPSKSKILPSTKLTLQKLPKTKLLAKVVKSGHTG